MSLEIANTFIEKHMKLKILYTILLSLTIFNLSSSAQKTFSINKNITDSISRKNYKIYMASANEVINFIGKKIAGPRRIVISKEQALIADKEFLNQFVRASLQQYSKQHKQTEKYLDSLEVKREEIKYQKAVQKLERNLIKDQGPKIQGYDRCFFGYLNEDGEKLVLMRFDPHQLSIIQSQEQVSHMLMC
jgi:hypothetical protein